MPEFTALIDGYRRFRTGKYSAERERWEELAEGQEPPVMVIGCCDSRVDPATIFDSRPGQMFVLRNVANLVPPCASSAGAPLAASAAIEFAVVDLKVKHVIVLGHGRCGGIAAALAGGDHGVPGGSFIDRWVSLLDPARDRVLAGNAEDKQHALELEGIRLSLANLRTFAFVAEREAAGTLKLHGAFFAIAEGVLHVLDETTGEFSAA